MSDTSDPDDCRAPTTYADQWLNQQLKVHQHRSSQVASDWPYGIGRCKNCGEAIDDGRPYCDESCRDDAWDRIKSDKRNGKYRGG